MIIIPAKYGSSRAPLKNFRVFYNNLSLLQIAIIRCVAADRGPVIVSSENAEAVLRQVSQLPSPYGGKVVVHERPEKLARDPATILDVMADYLQSLRGDLPEAVSVVLPTSPFNGIASITSAWEQFLNAWRLRVDAGVLVLPQRTTIAQCHLTYAQVVTSNATGIDSAKQTSNSSCARPQTFPRRRQNFVAVPCV